MKIEICTVNHKGIQDTNVIEVHSIDDAEEAVTDYWAELSPYVDYGKFEFCQVINVEDVESPYLIRRHLNLVILEAQFSYIMDTYADRLAEAENSWDRNKLIDSMMNEHSFFSYTFGQHVNFDYCNHSKGL